MRKSVAVIALLVVAGCGSTTGPNGVASSPRSPSNTVSSGRGSATAVPGTVAPTPATPTPTTAGEAPVSAEHNPPGDIPDNIAFVTYRNTAGAYAFTHPEGWSETTRGTTVTFTDKLNGVQLSVGSATAVPAVAGAKQRDVPKLASSQAAFELRDVTAANVPAGSGVKIVYRRNSAPDPVTGRQYRDEVERYEIFGAGHLVVVELFGPVGADNVDAYRTMIQSLRIG